ncbi:HAD-like domain-containing protein [Melanogaster broomeanus]|nr:HAD-like domain-containing protein [Melanogaster broomeanus]
MAATVPKTRARIRALLIDISGTLLIGSSPTPGAAQALARLREARVPFRFCSNTSKESTAAVHRKMLDAGLDVRLAELWTSIGAVKNVLRSKGLKRPYVLLSQSAKEECTDASPYITPDSSYDSVVIGLAPTLLNYENLNMAFRILAGEHQPSGAPTGKKAEREDVPLIALHRARYLEASDRALSLGPGPFVAALENASGKTAQVVGKPTRLFFETVMRDFRGDELGPDDVVAVIGDDVHADLGEGAIDLNLWRVLVKTGKYRSGDETRGDAQPPDEVCESFADFVDLLLERALHRE